MSPCDLVVSGGHVATMSPARPGPYGEIRDGLIAIGDGRIAWIGPEGHVPAGLVGRATPRVDLAGGWATPGLIDAHTHLVFGGHRADEFARRLRGASYEDIARSGGGILSTVRATREASEELLAASARQRLETLVDHGVTTIEIKSGYGLDLETEVRMLRAARTACRLVGIDTSTTLLAAHAVPPEFEHDREGYLTKVCQEIIPTVAAEGLADAVDAFCESIAFSVAECASVLRAGQEHGLAARLHADQLSEAGGAELAARVGARSADHLEYCGTRGAEAMSAAGTTAVLLPGAFYVLGQTRRPPVDDFRRLGVPMAVASDLNPGTSPLMSPLLTMNLACVLFGLTPEEALAGMTRVAAPVLGLSDRGRLEAGMRADVACWAVDDPSELVYWMGSNPARAVLTAGIRVR